MLRDEYVGIDNASAIFTAARRNIGEITRDISIAGNLPEAVQSRLMGIADECPVHETLTHEIKVRSRLTPTS